MCLVLYVTHIIAVCLIAHITVPQSRFRTGKGMTDTGPDGIIPSGQISFELYPSPCAKIIIVLAVHDLIEYAGPCFAVPVLPQPGQLYVHIRPHMPGNIFLRLQVVQILAAQLQKDLKLKAGAIQEISGAMSDAEPSTLVKRFMQLFNGLKEKGYPYGREYQLPALAVLAMSGRNAQEVMAEMIEVEAFLKPLKGYHGIFGFTKKERLMHAAMIVSLQEEENAVPDTGILTSTAVIIAAQQAAMCAMVAAMAASTSASSAH